MRTFAEATVLVIAAACTVAASDRQLTPDGVYRAYAWGDDLAVQRWVATLPATESPHTTHPEVSADAPRSRVTAAVLLEVAEASAASGRAVSGTDAKEGRRLVADSRSMCRSKRTAIPCGHERAIRRPGLLTPLELLR